VSCWRAGPLAGPGYALILFGLSSSDPLTVVITALSFWESDTRSLVPVERGGLTNDGLKADDCALRGTVSLSPCGRRRPVVDPA